MIKQKIPDEYIPYDRVWVCSNTFDEGKIILEVEGSPVFLIGKINDVPCVWLNIPTPTQVQGKPEWKTVIEKDRAVEEGFEVHKSEYGYAVLNKNNLLIDFRIEHEVLVISNINLMSVGLNVIGNLKFLTVSGMNLSNNKFKHVGTMIGIGGGDPVNTNQFK
jgi:hypothetical protein